MLLEKNQSGLRLKKIKYNHLNIGAISIRGYSHIADNKPCQDFFKIWRGMIHENPIIINAIADGLGNEQYDASHHGSQIATRTAVKLLKNIYKKSANEKIELFENVRSSFPKIILKTWKEGIRNKEKVKIDDNNIEFFKRYSTTLLFSLIDSAEIIFGQIGDGKILLVSESGNIDEPIPEDNLVGNETYALTSQDSSKLFKVRKFTVMEPTLVIMSTDGLSDSFEDNSEFHIFAKSLLDNIRKTSFNKVFNMLPDYLIDASKNGSLDDITILFFIIDPNIVKK